VAKSVERFGFTNPVLIDDDGQIIAGHGRVEADLFAHEAVETTLGTEALAHPVFSALRDARMRVLPHHMDWARLQVSEPAASNQRAGSTSKRLTELGVAENRSELRHSGS
jgi:hypothetical protein